MPTWIDLGLGPKLLEPSSLLARYGQSQDIFPWTGISQSAGGKYLMLQCGRRVVQLCQNAGRSPQALAIGVVSDVYEADVFDTEVAARAQELAQSVSPRSVRIMKRQIYEAASLSLAQACRNAAMEVSAALRSDDFREGVQHFMEGRAPHFTSR